VLAQENQAIAARIAAEQGAVAAAQARVAAEVEKAELARQVEAAEEEAAQAVLDKLNAQRLLLDSAQAHATMQRKVAMTTQAMAEARQQLLEIETGRHAAERRALAATGEAVAQRMAEAKQRDASESITREVIGRLLTQQSSSSLPQQLAVWEKRGFCNNVCVLILVVSSSSRTCGPISLKFAGRKRGVKA
jgi:hypothetical protein